MNLTPLFKAALEASWQGSLVILLILLVRPLLSFRVPARWRYLLWSLVLLRLLVPAFILPPSPASFQNLAVIDRPLEKAGIEYRAAPAREGNLRPGGFQGLEGDAAGIGFPEPPQRRAWWKVAAAAWLGGAGIAALWMLGATIHLQRLLRRDATAVCEPVQMVWERCCARAAAGHPPRLQATACVDSPALIGLFSPALLIPRSAMDTFTPEDWEHVFMHELAHFRRRDHWTQAVQLLALCAHWFNPLVWLGFRYLRADREMAADEWALGQLGGKQSAAYAGTLLKILTAHRRSSVPAGMVGIMEDAAQLKQRLRHIVAFGPRQLAGSIAGGALALALATVVLGRQLDRLDLSDYDGLPPADLLVSAARHGDRPALEKALAEGAGVNNEVSGPGEHTALTAAVAGEQLAAMQFLVEKGADANLKPEHGDGPLVIALKHGWTEGTDYLLSQGAQADAAMLAAAKGDAPAIEKIIGAPAPDFATLETLAEIAAANGHAPLLRSLTEAIQKMEDHLYWHIGEGAGAMAIARGHREVIEELMRQNPGFARYRVSRYAAAAASSPGMREWLISKGFSVPEESDGERLIGATEREDLPEMRHLLAAGADLNYRGESEWTPLTKAATWGRPRAVKLLLDRHADPNVTKGTGKFAYTALCLARSTEIAEMLAGAGAQVRPEDIWYSVDFGPAEMVRWFLDRGVDPSQVKHDERMPTLLFMAGTGEIAELLIAHGVSTAATDEYGRTALHHLEMASDPAGVAEVLLRHGMDPNARDKDGATPLHTAPDGPTVEVLLKNGADLNATDGRGDSVLLFKGIVAKPSRLAALVKHGLTGEKTKDFDELFRKAVMGNNQADLGRLIALGFIPSPVVMRFGDQVQSALRLAIKLEHFELTGMLRKAGAQDVTFLAEAAAQGDLQKMAALLDAGTDPNESSGMGERPLSFAIEGYRTEAVKLLLERGANPNQFDEEGFTAYALLEYLQMGLNNHETYELGLDRGHTEEELKARFQEIRSLLAHDRPDVEFRNPAGETAIFDAAESADRWLVENYVALGAKIDVRRLDGMTPLMVAVLNAWRDDADNALNPPGTPDQSNHGMVVTMLLKKGADRTLRNPQGKTAADLAREKGRQGILALLESPDSSP